MMTRSARSLASGSLLLLCLALAPATASLAAPKADAPLAAEASAHPSQMRVRKTGEGFIYTDARGRTLYALNQRIAFSRSGGRSPYCIGACKALWAEASAPAKAEPVGDWSIVDGVDGPQWAYRKNPVFTYRADTAPGQTKGDGYQDLWGVIEHVPPAPALAAPDIVSTRYANSRYVLTEGDGHVLFVVRGKAACATACGDWTPLLAGLSALDVGAWRVDRDAPRARWTYRGQAVFVSPGDDPASVPDGGQALTP